LRSGVDKVRGALPGGSGAAAPGGSAAGRPAPASEVAADEVSA
jgi:hypothetical protein